MQEFEQVPKLGVVVAAIGGSLAQLVFLRGLSPLEALGAVGVGMLTAFFATDPISHLINVDGSWDGFIGFLLGLTAMSIGQGLFTLLKWWGEDPLAVLDRLPFIGRKGKDDDRDH